MTEDQFSHIFHLYRYNGKNVVGIAAVIVVDVVVVAAT